MTRIESTSRPPSHTARTKRSTSTAVLPVPAPAETKTSPVASTAASCCSFTTTEPPQVTVCYLLRSGSRSRSRPLHAAHRPEVAPGRALAVLRVVADVARADPAAELARLRARALDERPEGLLVVVVVPREAVQRLALA